MDKNILEKNDLDFKKIWDSAKKIVASETSVLQYDVWIKALEPIGIRGDALILKSPSAGARNVIQNSHTEKINDAIKSITPHLTTFEVVVEDEMDDADLFFDDAKDKHEDKKSKNKNAQSSTFNPKFTFENYVVGPTNEFTVAAAKAVAENPGGQYNPLFVYGGAGLGKTHVLHAIGNQLVETRPELTVVYVTTEQFTNEFIETVSKNELDMNTGLRY